MGHSGSSLANVEGTAVEASKRKRLGSLCGRVKECKQIPLRKPDSSKLVVSVKAVIPVSGRYTCRRKLEDDYNISSKVLGSGMNGPVKLATSRDDGRKYAIKSFNKKGMEPNMVDDLKNEAELYLALDHPHITRLEMVYETEDMLYLVMEHMAGGELYDRLSASKQYTEEKAANTVHQMLLAIAYLHARNIAHRDLKLENFLYERTDSEHLKLIDFGFAKFWDENTRMTQACGSIHYVAPEVLAHSYTVQADMWSLGILSYMLLLGSPPFHGSDDDVLKGIKAGQPRYSSRFPKLSSNAQDFVKSLLVFDPKLRLSAQQAFEHQWIVGRKKAVETTLDLSILSNLRNFAHASHFRRAILSMASWSLSSEDRASLREQFLLMDKSKSGKIRYSDLRLIFEENFAINNEEVEALFSSLDPKSDKELEYSDFLSAALLGRVKVHEDLLRKTFARFDKDCSGLISKSELATVLGGSFDEVEINDMIRDVDTSGDGEIDYNEFIAYFQKTDSDDSRHRNDKRAFKRKRRTEQLALVIDQLLEATESGKNDSDADATSPVSSACGCFCYQDKDAQNRTPSIKSATNGALPTLLTASRSISFSTRK